VVASEHRPTVTLRDPTILAPDRQTHDEPEGKPLPENIGRFIIQGVLGAGGMGTVLDAYDEALERRVAIKVMHPVAGGHDRRHALRREARALGGVSHPNVVEVFEVGEYEGQLFIAMELVEGSTLVQWLAADERSFERIRDMLCDAGRGLQAAHARGLLHRDFKPENVLVGSDGRPRVVDFGLVSRLPVEDLTMTPVSLGPMTLGGKQAGTVPFMAPEQLMGWPLDARADQFAFCVTLYEAVYGAHPFDAPGLMEIGLRIIAGEMDPPPPRSDVPRWLPAVLARGMAPRPTDRFASMGALLDALQPSSRPRRSRSWSWAAGAMTLMATGVAASWVARDGSDASRGQEQLVVDAWGPLRSHEQDARVAGLRARLVGVRLEDELGHSARALELLEGIVQDARLVDHPPLSAEVLFVLGMVHMSIDLEQAEEALSDAFWLAQSNGQAGLAVDAGTALIHLTGDTQMRFEDGMAWVRHTRAIVEREAMGGRRHAWLLNNHGMLLFRQGRFEEAGEKVSAALEFEGLDERDRASFLTNLGLVYPEGRGSGSSNE